MNEPVTKLDTRYSEPDGVVTPWEQTRRVLETAELFWLSTVRADGRPHATPVVAVWHDGALYFSTADTEQKARNLRAIPHVILLTGCNCQGRCNNGPVLNWPPWLNELQRTHFNERRRINADQTAPESGDPNADEQTPLTERRLS